MPPRLNNLTAGIPSFEGSSELAARAGQTVTGGLATITNTLQGIGESRRTQVEGDIRAREDAVRGSFDLAIANALSLEDKQAVVGQIRNSALSDTDQASRLNTLFPAIQQQAGATFDAQNAGRVRNAEAELQSDFVDNPVDPIYTLRQGENAGTAFRAFSRQNNLEGNLSIFNFLGDGNADLQSGLNQALRDLGVSPASQEAGVLTQVALNITPLLGDGDDRTFDEATFRTNLSAVFDAYQIDVENRDRRADATSQFNQLSDNLVTERNNFIQQFL